MLTTAVTCCHAYLLVQQARLHERRGEKDDAAQYHKMNLQRIDEQSGAGQDAVEALQFLGQYSLVSTTGFITEWIASSRC